MRADAFSKRHPAVNFVFFLGAILGGMLNQHPAYLLAGVVSGAAYYLLLHGRRGWRFIGGLVPLFLVFTAVNPLFNTYGATLLFTYFDRRTRSKHSITVRRSRRCSSICCSGSAAITPC